MKAVAGVLIFFIALTLVMGTIRALPLALSGRPVALFPGGDRMISIPCPQGGPAAALCARTTALLSFMGQVVLAAALLALLRRAFR